MIFQQLAIAILVVVAFAIPSASAQPSGLAIVVIAGEGAVNIIQQKTAVNPIVEVRDRNNLPVSGVAVTFSVGGQGASFAGGASTLTVTTNAAGQAVVAGMTPTATGAVTINASAIVNGQTIAATISQTNFATAQAAAAAGGGASGASSAGATAGGGGGGISGTTIGIVGAAVGGGALAATQLTGGGEDPDAEGPVRSGTFSGQITLTFPGNSPQQTCSRVHTMTGTLRISLKEGSTGGTAEIQGTSVVASNNCGAGPQTGATDTFGMPPTEVTGSAGALAFTSETASSFPAIPPGAAGIHTVRLVFSGALNGNVINGTLAHSVTIESPGSGIPAGTGAATYAVTIQ